MTSVLEAIALIDAAIGAPSAEQIRREQERKEHEHLRSMGLLPHEMGGTQTKGCSSCGGTMYKTYERDSPESQYVCAACGAVE